MTLITSLVVRAEDTSGDVDEKVQPARWPARPTPVVWEQTCTGRDRTRSRLTRPPFVLDDYNKQNARTQGLKLLLDWLDTFPGETWQDRWMTSGADTAGWQWRTVPGAWIHSTGHTDYHHEVLVRAVTTAISADVLRPSPGWFVTCRIQHRTLVCDLTAAGRGDGFAELAATFDADPMVSATAANRCLQRATSIVGAKGGTIADITPGDVLEFLDTEGSIRGTGIGATRLFYRSLHSLGVFGTQAPATLPELRSPGQKPPAELIDRYSIACRPIRDLLVEYLRERQPAVDYSSLVRLSGLLGKLFWSDLERHHPGISSLRLSTEVVDAWKQRLRTVTTRTRTPGGEIVETTSPRLDYFGVLVAVRALYLDLAQWALEDPARWGPWVAPCPISGNEIDRRKEKRHRKSRMDTRTRERFPVLPVLVRSVAKRRTDAAELLAAAQQTSLGDQFTAAGQTLIRSRTKEKTPGKLWAHDPDTGERRDLAREEAHAFWAFAAVEVLRATGIRIEELSELSHHSLIQYRLPTTGEVVPLLQIAPSKTDAERLLLVSPELADVLSLIIGRIRGADGAVPQVAVFDLHERTWSDPAPLLFQRRLGSENQAIGPRAIREMLTSALSATGLTEPSTGRPLRCTPHDFRRMFITDAILNGLPPHIAQVIAGHRDINVTMGYKAVYPDEAIQAHHAFLARRRALRPTDEYRVPTDAEWEEFLGHFERRKVSTGTCGRSFGTPCLHEHACIRCPMLWPDPNQRERMVEIRDNLHARITEAEREGWLGEVEGLQISLAAAEDKLAQIDRRIHDQTTADLGIPLPPKPQSRAQG